MTITPGSVGTLIGDGVASVERLAAGWESELLVATTTGGQRLVIRCLEGAEVAVRTSSEASGVGTLRQMGFPVPEVVALDGSGSILGRPGIVYEFVDGPLCGDGLGTVTERSRLVGRLLRALHSLPVGAFAGQVGLDVPADPVARQIELWLTAMGAFPVPEVETAVEWLVERAASVERAPAAVTHMDLHPWNVICSAEGPVVVDWAQVGVSDPRFDLSWSVLLADSGGWGDGAIVVEEYGGLVPDLDWFRAAAAIKRIYSVVLSLRAGPEALGMRGEALEQIAQSVGELEHAAMVFESVSGVGLEVPR